MMDETLDKFFKEKLKELDTVYPAHLPAPGILWQQLAERRNRITRIKMIMKVAAALLIVLMAGFAVTLRNTSPDDVVATHHLPPTSSSAEQDALNYIAMRCAETTTACNNPQVKDLQKDLERSFKQLEEIDQQISFYGDDATLTRARTRIERHQARVIKAIIQTL